MGDLTYKFIGCEDDVRKFYKLHLEPFKDEAYLSFILVPIARRKYWKELGCSQKSINTRVFSSKKTEDMFVRELRKYEVKEGLYVDFKNSDNPIPSHAIGIYVTADPMSELKAYFSFQKEVGERLQRMVLKDSSDKDSSDKDSSDKDSSDKDKKDDDNTPRMDVMSIYKSCLHSSPERIFRKLDVDTKEPEKIRELQDFLTFWVIRPHLVVESRSGFHVVLHNEHSFTDGKKVCKNTMKVINATKNKALYEFCEKNYKWVSIEKNPLIVIPGTYQGGFLTKLVDWYKRPSVP